MPTKKSDVTIFVSSCDLYEDAWMPFFKLLKKHWPDCTYPMVLSTEEKVYECDFAEVKTIPTGKDISWTERIRIVLNQIDTEFVLFFLEDFFLLKDVRTEAFSKALDLIRGNSDIGMVHFTPTEINMPEPGQDLDNCFYELPVRRRTLRTRVAVTLFRKEYFLRLLYGDESPWQYERESHLRSMYAGYKIIRQDYGKYPPTFPYILDHIAGIGITARKWLPNTQLFLESEGISGIDYQRLGILTEAEQATKSKPRIRDIGFKQWTYQNITHPIKRSIRHNWLLQDIITMKKRREYRKYYKALDK